MMEVTTIAFVATPSAGGVEPVRPAGLSDASARFSALMEAESPQRVPLAVEANGADVFVPPPPESASLGDAILGGMRQMSSDFSHKWSQVQQMVEQDVTSLQDLLRMQIGLTQASVQYEMVGKAISKSTQNFDQLVKLQ